MTRQEILPAVSAIVLNENNEILLQRRRDTNKWCIISGHVEFGETVEQAIIREVLEEANVTCEVMRLIGVYSSPDYTTYHHPDRTVQYIVTYFQVRLKSKIEGSFANDETVEFAYFPLDQLPADLDLINPFWLSDALAESSGAFFR